MPNETTRCYRIRGEVQGVGFRWWAKRQADALGLRGTVRNLADGTVEVVARGDTETLEHFRSLLHEGPPAARVEAVVEAAIEEPAASPSPSSGFEIVR